MANVFDAFEEMMKSSKLSKDKEFFDLKDGEKYNKEVMDGSNDIQKREQYEKPTGEDWKDTRGFPEREWKISKEDMANPKGFSFNYDDAFTSYDKFLKKTAKKHDDEGEDPESDEG
jgi:hypothetical protein